MRCFAKQSEVSRARSDRLRDCARRGARAQERGALRQVHAVLPRGGNASASKRVEAEMHSGEIVPWSRHFKSFTVGFEVRREMRKVESAFHEIH